ncbi:MAG: TMEM165/GDT1 family protein [candidate division WOR-3 bacterium]|nr:TMEM165/GDT1 family protein [candidate division WOR-3 bacterium]
MDWRLLLTTFGSIFIAELGDKTQLATLCFATGKNTLVPVFIGSSLALVTSSLLACLLGSTLTRVLPIRWIHLAAGLAFIVIGALLVVRTIRAS